MDPAHETASDRSDPAEQEFAGLASRYEARWSRYVEASVRETLLRLEAPPGGRVLDVGCGTGALLSRLAGERPDLVLAGVEPTREMLDVARARLSRMVRLQAGRAESLPWPDNGLDAVVSTSVLHFIPEPDRALTEMRRVLVPGGRVAITDWCDDFLACRLCDLFLRLRNRSHRRAFGSGRCRELLEDAGFLEVRVDRYKIHWMWGLMTATARTPGDE